MCGGNSSCWPIKYLDKLTDSIDNYIGILDRSKINRQIHLVCDSKRMHLTTTDTSHDWDELTWIDVLQIDMIWRTIIRKTVARNSDSVVTSGFTIIHNALQSFTMPNSSSEKWRKNTKTKLSVVASAFISDTYDTRRGFTLPNGAIDLHWAAISSSK